MAVPWLKIIQWVPSVVELSRELSRKSKPSAPADGDPIAQMQSHIALVQENGRRQAELITRMAEQSATLSEAIAALHRQLRFTQIAAAVAIAFGLSACLVAWLK